jgi:cytochrome oxidase Cu insertion factor (SCO1/SenC/PrrC family)
MLGVIIAGVVGFGVWSLLWDEPFRQTPSPPSPAHLPVYGAVPDFALIDQRVRPVRHGDLIGKVWIASFIFTHCPDECPLMTAEMARFQSDLADFADLRLVSISIDPDRDTPAVLAQYAERFDADPDRWFFLTGDKGAIYQLAKEGFRLGIVDPTEPSHLSPGKGRPPGGSRSSVDQPWPNNLGWTGKWRRNLSRWLSSVVPATAFADHGATNDPLHSTRFVLIDRLAQIRGYYDSREEAALQRLRQHLQILIRDG